MQINSDLNITQRELEFCFPFLREIEIEDAVINWRNKLEIIEGKFKGKRKMSVIKNAVIKGGEFRNILFLNCDLSQSETKKINCKSIFDNR